MDRLALILVAVALVLVSASASANFGTVDLRGPTTIDASINRGVWQMNRATATALELRGLHNMNIANNSLAVNSSRFMFPSKLAQVSRGLAKSLGPAGLAFALTSVVWDAATRQWMKPGTVQDDGSYPSSCSLGTETIPLVTSNGTACYQICRPTSATCSAPFSSVGIFSAPSCSSGTAIRCRALNYQSAPGQPATDAEIEQAILEKLSDATKILQQANLIAQSLGRLQDLLDAADPVTSTDGPSTAPKVTETTSETGPEGTTITTTEITPHIQYSTTTNIINIRTTTITNIKYPDGREETKTKEEESDKPKKDDEDFCKKNPTSILCRELGDLEAPDLPEEELDLEWNKERSATGSCPSPITVTYFGRPIIINWDLVCQFAQGIRPMVLLVSVLGAGIWIFSVFRR